MSNHVPKAVMESGLKLAKRAFAKREELDAQLKRFAEVLGKLLQGSLL